MESIQSLIDETLRAESVLMLQPEDTRGRLKKYALNQSSTDAFIIYAQLILKRAGVDYCNINWFDFRESVLRLL
jgi:hypothetical protein